MGRSRGRGLDEMQRTEAAQTPSSIQGFSHLLPPRAQAFDLTGGLPPSSAGRVHF